MSELYHHGIPGQRKGQRNGPPYPLDPEDHSSAELKANPGLRKQVEEAKEAEKAEKKSAARYAKFIKLSLKSSRQNNHKKLEKLAKDMSDEELKKANERLTLENTYISLIQKNSPAREKRMQWAKDAVTNALRTVGTQVATVAISKGANATISKILGEDVEWVNPMNGREPRDNKPNQQKNNTNNNNNNNNNKNNTNNNNKKTTDNVVQAPNDYVPDSYKLEPRLSSNGTIVWAMPQNSKQRKRKKKK